jgi:hypothetical protein
MRTAPDIDILIVNIIDPSSAFIGDRARVGSRLIQAVRPWQISSHYRLKAEQALRIARDSTDLWLIETLHAYAAECNAKADAIDGIALGEDPEDD